MSPFTSASPAAQSQIFGSAAGFNLAYTGYTGFPLQVRLSMPVFPSGGRLTVNSDLPGCCMPTHGLFSSPAPLPFAGAVTMGGLTLAFDLSAGNLQPSVTLSWNRPCLGNVGATVICMSAAEAAAAPGAVGPRVTQPLCVSLTVFENAAPVFLLPTKLSLEWTMGRLGTIDVHVVDSAPQDTVASLGVLSNTSLPSGAALVGLALTGPVGRAQLQWVPAAGAGGGSYQICFGTADRRVSPYDRCLSGQRSNALCVVIDVVRCRYAARPRESLMDIAYMFQTDWIQLWALNPAILEPDYGVGMEAAVLHTGHLYQVDTGDYLSAIAYKMGVTLKNLLLHNADLAQSPDDPLNVGKVICVIPSSCKREGA